jgi:hypothetical protein
MAAAPGVVHVIQEWLASVPPHLPSDVVIRALVEALDYHCGERLYRVLRGMAGRHVAVDVAPNRLCARGMCGDPRGRRDQGLATAMLTPGGSVGVRVEWTRAAWPTPVRVATCRLFKSIDDLHLTSLGGDPPRFFGARATSAAEHATRLSTLARHVEAHGSVNFVVLPEFALHDDPAWAAAIASTGSYVVAGIGHVHGERNIQQHQRIAALDERSQTIVVKSAPSTYEQGGRTWHEDIHRGKPRVLIAMSGDGAQQALLVGEDLHEWPASLFNSLRPDILLAVCGPLGATLIERVTELVAGGAHCILVGIGATLERSTNASSVELLGF